MPIGIAAFDAWIVMDSKDAEVTIRFVEPEIAPNLAVIEVEPEATPVALPELSIVATLVAEEDHWADVDRSRVPPSS
jgi:hypothetical protein